MPFEQTRDVIERARAFHRQLAERFHRIERQSDRERIQMLMDYLAAHEERMERRLAAFETKSARSLLDMWYQYPPPDDVVRALEQIRLSPDMTIPEIVCAALHLDEQILRLYRWAADSAPSPQVREVFEALLNEHKEERRRLVFGLFVPDL
ncbi:MAG: hypothetical protein N2652_04200 [Kiritimatiellae bacterium]|nr:hypothetical protein [Kiritimatiellia bacterium]